MDTSSEPDFSKYWFPCKQVLNDKADSTEMIVTTESTYKTASNGLLVSAVNLRDNKIRYTWKSKYPIVYYCISIAVGPYNEFDTYVHPDGLSDSLLIQNYLISSSPLINQHMVAIQRAKTALILYSHLFGTYPFKDEKYGQCVSCTSYDGMENQTMTTLGYLDFDTTNVFI